jgi:two-component system OmpR family sensor kinase
LPDEAVIVTGDATRLSQVLANLLANARVHTPPGTTVLAELNGGPAEASLRVVDDGPGIPPALLPHVFGRFARGDSSRSRAAGSTGLGLAIAHAVVMAHGGWVGVESVPGRTVFTVRLPMHGATRVEPPRNGAAASGAPATASNGASPNGSVHSGAVQSAPGPTATVRTADSHGPSR